MPKIQELIDAEVARAAFTPLLKPLYQKLADLDRQAEKVRQQIQNTTRQADARLDEATQKQRKCLTKWVLKMDSFTRYALKMDGPSDLCWDSRAWLRRMFHVSEQKWHWTLDIHRVTYRQVKFDEFDDVRVPQVVGAPLEAVSLRVHPLLAAADAVLQEEGWILTNLDNDNEDELEEP